MRALFLQKKENLFWIDFIRVIASFGVITIHVAADVITEWGAVPASWWWSAHIYDSLVRGCVPIFIMISGALLLPSKESLSDFFRKRFYRVIIPFMVWTAIYLLWKKWLLIPDLTLEDALRRAAGNNVHFHLWFLYILVGLYLVTPVFRFFCQQASRKEILYFIILWFAMTSFLPMAQKFADKFWHTNFYLKIPIEPAQGFIGYFVLGYFLRVYAESKWIFPAAVTWLVSLGLCFGGTYALAAHFKRYDGMLYDNLAPNVVFYAGAFFVLMMFWGNVIASSAESGTWQSRCNDVILGLSKASFGIYLIHPVFLDVLIQGRWGFVLTGKMSHPAWAIPTTTVVVFILSFFTVWIIQKIPYLKKIV